MVLDEDLETILKEVKPEEQLPLIVKIRDWEGSYLEEVLNFSSSTLRHQIPMLPAFSLKLAAAEIEELAVKSWVERIEEDKQVYASEKTSQPPDSGETRRPDGHRGSGSESSLPLEGLSQLWQTPLRGEGVRVAIIGSGIDKNHPDFEGRLKATADFTLEGFKDLNGHGTHTAGIVAGSGQGSKGKYKGVAPQAQILVAKVLKGDGTGRSSDVMAAIEWAFQNQAQVINLSLGAKGSSDGSDALSETCDEAARRGVVVCAAAGNGGPQRRTIGSPGASREVITAGATNAQGELADFSSQGPTLDGRGKPDIVAPGVDIVSARAKGTSLGKVIDDFYIGATGTSVSCAFTSGLAALLLEAKKEASPLLIKEALMHTAKDLEVPEEAQGAGRVQAEAALEYLKTHENPPELSEIEHKPGYLTYLLELGHLVRQKLTRKSEGVKE